MTTNIKALSYARFRRHAKPLFLWFKKYHWLVVFLVALCLILMERFEGIHEEAPVNISLPFSIPYSFPYHILEIILYLMLVGLIGILIDLLIRSLTKRDHALKILEYKHKLSLEMTKFEDWKTLTAQLGRLPSTIAPVCQSDLYVRNSYSEQFEMATQWSANGSKPNDYSNERQKEAGRAFGFDFTFKPGQTRLMAVKSASAQNEYYYLINSSSLILGVIWFKMQAGVALSNEQKDIFENIGDELAIALKAGNNHQRYSQLLRTEIALTERRSVSAYLHDNVSQNLAYLCLKLDQFATNENLASDGCLHTDLTRMRDAANQSYEIVRNTIETIQPETTPHLSNLLFEHATKISHRANFEVVFQSSGEPMPVPPDLHKSIFYVFQEILSNIEKHAKATCVNISVGWEVDSLSMTISDNGMGFNPKEVNGKQHFGLAITEERIENLNGWIKLKSSEQTGTSVMVFVPLAQRLNDKILNQGVSL